MCSGAYLALYPRARVWSLVPFLFFIPLRIPAWLVLGLWFVLQWAYAVGGSAAGGVAYVAHVFGFVCGLLVGLVVRAASSGPPARARTLEVPPWLSTGLFDGVFARGGARHTGARRGCGPCWTPRRRWPGRWNGPGWPRPARARR